MSNRHVLRIFFVLVAGLSAPLQAKAEKLDHLTGPPSPNEVVKLIGELSHPSYQKRTFATRRLCAIGPPARERLEVAAGGEDAETALRARAVLAVLDGLMFAGVEVRIAFSKPTAAWDEPVDLKVTLVNRSNYPARVPFELDEKLRSATPTDAGQVGDMLDLADLLKVRGVDGREIELTVDDIAEDPAVVAVVQEKLNGEAISELQPGERVTFVVRAFNRGWSRYKLLTSGDYTVTLEYLPAWDDVVLATHRVGRVVSNETKITITTQAPSIVRDGGTEASLVMERRGKFIVVSLTNGTDQTLRVNKDFGRSPPFASGQWIWELDRQVRRFPLIARKSVSWRDFDLSLLVAVHPGESIELTRVEAARLRQSLSEEGADLSSGRWTLHFAYENLCNRQWQKRQGSALLGNPAAPPMLAKPLPRRILSARQTSNRIPASLLD